ncbi:MAG: hypothetical protein LEGION0403_FIIPPAGN_02728 [Legionella sp.]|uniref:DUF5681 domain-containing protein n=1 Tax=Legionella sp. TaxID=459 RepID=UPI003D0CF294
MAFQTGISGNPSGRPRGTGSRQQIFSALVEPHKEALFNVAINMALKGNEAMLRLFLERMLPAKPSDEPIQFSIPDCNTSYTQTISCIGKEALQAVTSGVITPDEAGRVASLIGANARLISLVELNQRMKAFEDKEAR